jgi:predicted enzyme related to lactoylglutathione lyase
MTRKKSVHGAIPIRAVDFVMYCAGHPKKTRAWYQKIFGFSPGEEWNEFWSEFATEPVTFCLNGPNKARREEMDWDGAPAIAFAVEDIHEAAVVCRKQKIPILRGPVETSVCWMLFIADPEQNRIVLHQRKNGTAG